MPRRARIGLGLFQNGPNCRHVNRQRLIKTALKIFKIYITHKLQYYFNICERAIEYVYRAHASIVELR